MFGANIFSLIIIYLFSQGVSQEDQARKLVFESSLLASIYAELAIDSSTVYTQIFDAGFVRRNEYMLDVDGSTPERIVVEITNDSIVTHIGVDIFPYLARKHIDPVGKFLERELLLSCCMHEVSVASRAPTSEFTISYGSDDLRNLNTSIRQNLETCLEPTLSRQDNSLLIACEGTTNPITIEGNLDISNLTGMDKAELEQSFNRMVNGPPVKCFYPEDESATYPYYENIDFSPGGEIANGINGHLFYWRDTHSLVISDDYKTESIQNIFISPIDREPLSLSVTHEQYNPNTHLEVDYNIVDCLLRASRHNPFLGFESQTQEDGSKVILVYENEVLQYYHIFLLEVASFPPTKSVVKGRLYSYVRFDNIDRYTGYDSTGTGLDFSIKLED